MYALKHPASIFNPFNDFPRLYIITPSKRNRTIKGSPGKSEKTAGSFTQ